MHLIVGVDAGINVGYAVLDLSGKLIAAGCERDANDESIVKIISSHGIPSIVAGDTSPPSGFVSKIAARFNVRLFYPSKSLTTDEKKEIGKEISDPHVRDAYAAAVKAYRKYAGRLRQVDKIESIFGKDELKNAVIRGKAIGRILNGIEKID